MEMLRGVFGDTIPDPSEILITDWSLNSLANGSYSSMPAGWDITDYNILARNEGRVHFAGEHLSQYNIGTVHGAYDSGASVACEVVDAIGFPCADHITTLQARALMICSTAILFSLVL
jgi:polyamine oxidase